MSKLDKLADIAGAASNPLSAAKATVESARGLVNETYGLVEDVRAIAEKEVARKEQKVRTAVSSDVKARERATKAVTRRDTNNAVTDYNTTTDAIKEATRQTLINIKKKEEEHALYWSMTQDERFEYDRVRKEQNEKIRKEQLRITREKYARQERNELIIGVVIGLVLLVGGLYGMLFWLAYATQDPKLMSIVGIN
jgi:hypothetical protein